MKKIVAFLSVLAVGAMLLPVQSTAQDTIININHGRPAQTTLPPVYAAAPAPVYAPAYAAPAAPLYAGTGCRGYSAGGCQGQQAGGCQGRSYAPIAYAAPPAYTLVPMQTGGCIGRTGGCQGSAMYAGGYAAVPVYGGAVYAGPRPFAYAVDGTPIERGAPRGDGKYATESGKPLPLGVIPWDGPIIGTLRDAAGYNRRR